MRCLPSDGMIIQLKLYATLEPSWRTADWGLTGGNVLKDFLLACPGTISWTPLQHKNVGNCTMQRDKWLLSLLSGPQSNGLLHVKHFKPTVFNRDIKWRLCLGNNRDPFEKQYKQDVYTNTSALSTPQTPLDRRFYEAIRNPTIVGSSLMV